MEVEEKKFLWGKKITPDINEGMSGLLEKGFFLVRLTYWVIPYIF